MFGRKKTLTISLVPEDDYTRKLDGLIRHCDERAITCPHVAIAMKAKAAAYLNAKRLYMEMSRELITELHENNIEAIKRRDRGE